MNFYQQLTGWRWGGDRMDMAVRLATGKSVLHVGCVDEGIVSRETLHEKLGKVASRLVGVDIIMPPIDGIYLYCRMDFQSEKWQDMDLPEFKYFDLVVCTEVLEHLDSVGPFLRNLRSVGAKEYLFTVPNAFSLDHNAAMRHPYFLQGPQKPDLPDIWAELIHPDHRCWFSPYTLENVLRMAGYEPKEKFMLGWKPQLNRRQDYRDYNIFTTEGVGILAI